MTVLNGLDRFHLAAAALDRVPRLGKTAAHMQQHSRDRLIEHRHFVRRVGNDLPDVMTWRWPAAEAPEPQA